MSSSVRSLYHPVLEAADCLFKTKKTQEKSEVDLPAVAAQGFVTKNTETLFSEELATLGDTRARKAAAESCLLLGSLL